MEGGVNFLQDLAKNPKGKMARYIDANVSTERGGKSDIKSVERAVEKVREVVDIPLSIDSPDPQILEAGYFDKIVLHLLCLTFP